MHLFPSARKQPACTATRQQGSGEQGPCPHALFCPNFLLPHGKMGREGQGQAGKGREALLFADIVPISSSEQRVGISEVKPPAEMCHRQNTRPVAELLQIPPLPRSRQQTLSTSRQTARGRGGGEGCVILGNASTPLLFFFFFFLC